MVATLRKLTPLSIPFVLALVFFLPIAAGCLSLLAQTGFSWLQDIQSLFAQPGVWSAWKMTISIALLSTLGTVAITLFLIANLTPLLHHKNFWYLLSPCVAMPHIAFALGLALFLAPSGWLLKLLSPWLTGLERPATWTLVQEPFGIALIVCLICKEVPFLLMLALSNFNWKNINTQLMTCQALGYSRPQAMWCIVFPHTFKHIRLPLYAIAAYSVSVVDLSLLLGPNTPPTFPVMIWQWSLKSDVMSQKWAAQGSVLLWGTTVLFLLFLYGLEHLFCKQTRLWQLRGTRRKTDRVQSALSKLFLAAVIGIFVMTFIVLLLWSVSAHWSFPAALPTQWTFSYWSDSINAKTPLLWNSFLLALTSSVFCLCLAIACLEYQQKKQQHWPIHLLCFPLFMPQVALLTGVQTLWLNIGLFHGFFAVFWGHCLFVFPYVYLSLYGPYRAYDMRHTQTVLSLGKPIWVALVRIKWPLLTYPITMACAVGFGVSMAQYLPTVLLGGGRMNTIATEAVNTGVSLDRQYAGIYALCQLLLPALMYLGAYFWGRKKRMLYGAHS